MPSQSKRRSQGGGRTPNSEPRVQTFKEFGGCNFELSPRDFTLGKEVPQEQSDLQMNFVVIQNNACITSNKTIETRNNLVELFEAPEGVDLTQANILIGDEFYIGLSDGALAYRSVTDPGVFESIVDLIDISGLDLAFDDRLYNGQWSDLEYIDDKLIATTEQYGLWSGEFGNHELSNARPLPQPNPLDGGNIRPVGLTTNQYRTEECPHRIKIGYTYVNKYGPTTMSTPFEFYCSIPVNEFNGQQYIQIYSAIPVDLENFVEAVEIYYAVGDATELIFLGRADIDRDDPITGLDLWYYNWTGYLEDVSIWPMAHLIPPEDNYTRGPMCKRLTCIDQKLYFWDQANYEENIGGQPGAGRWVYRPYRLCIGGNPGNLLNICSSTGGGFVDVEPGTNQAIRSVLKYKTQSGNSIVTLMCDAPNTRKERRYNLVEDSAALANDQAVKSWKAEHVAGSIGCKSKIEGAVACADGLYSISRYGVALTTMTMEYNSQIRTNYISDPIKPVFTDRNADILEHSVLLECDGILYVAFGRNDTELDNILFCYDIDGKAWWTVTLDIDEPILNLTHIDYEGAREGIGIITDKHVYLLPTTHDDDIEENPDFDFVIQTGELATTQPQSNWIHLSQLEFRFDYFIGTALIELTGIDQFGRTVSTKKKITHGTTEYDLAEYLRVDLKLQSYQIRISGRARFRLSHFMAKLYTISNKQGLVWGFDDSQSSRKPGDIHPTFRCYNDIREAVMV